MFSLRHNVTSSNQLSRSSVGSATKVRTAYSKERNESRKRIKRYKSKERNEKGGGRRNGGREGEKVIIEESYHQREKRGHVSTD